MAAKRLFTTAEAGRELGVSEAQVRAMIRDGVIAAEHLGGRWILDEDALEELETALADDDADGADSDGDEDEDDETEDELAHAT